MIRGVSGQYQTVNITKYFGNRELNNNITLYTLQSLRVFWLASILQLNIEITQPMAHNSVICYQLVEPAVCNFIASGSFKYTNRNKLWETSENNMNERRFCDLFSVKFLRNFTVLWWVGKIQTNHSFIWSFIHSFVRSVIE